MAVSRAALSQGQVSAVCWHRREVDAPSALGGAGGPLWTTLDPSLEYKEVAALLAVGAPLPTVSSGSSCADEDAVGLPGRRRALSPGKLATVLGMWELAFAGLGC